MEYLTVFPLEIRQGMSEEDSCVLMLAEPKMQRVVPVVITTQEMESLGRILQSSDGISKTSYGWMFELMQQFCLEIKEAVIDNVVDGVFKSSMLVSDGFNQHRVECNIFDIVIASIKVGCDIKLAQRVMDEAGCDRNALMDNLPNQKSLQREVTIDDLLAEQAECEEREDYERASEIQRIIDQMLSADDEE